MARYQAKSLAERCVKFTGLGLFVGIFFLNQSAFAAAAGRPIISGGTVKTADGRLLRGAHAHIAQKASPEIRRFFMDVNNVIKLRDQSHMNVIRLCDITPASGWGGFPDFDSTVAYTDAIVASCEAAGIYVIIDYHGTWFYDGSKWDIRNFWDFYAPRYKDKPFVIYELMNESYGGGAPSGTANDWPTNQNVDLYVNHVRKWAPNNLVMGLLEPVECVDNWGPFLRDVLGPACGIDWSAGKDAWAFHAYGGTNSASIKATRAAGIPVVCSEWTIQEEGWPVAIVDGCHYMAEWCEKNDVSWMLWQDFTKGTPQLQAISTYLLPDAIAKNYAWWTGSAVSPVAGYRPRSGKSSGPEDRCYNILGRLVAPEAQRRKAATVLPVLRSGRQAGTLIFE
jgi:hypothetical protein